MADKERSYVARFLSSQFQRLPYPAESFKDAVIIVTGGNSGLGLEAARHFVRLGAATVILAVRDTQSGEKAKESIEASTKIRNVVEVWPLDLARQQSVKDFATKASSLRRLDVLVASAGISTSEFQLVEGSEKNIQVNVISTFLLTLSLLPKLRESASQFNVRPRIVIVSSEGHETTTFQEQKYDDIFGALNDESRSNMDERYDTSKLLQLYAVRALSEELGKSDKPKVTINAVNPGLCRTRLLREAPLVAQVIVSPIKLVIARSAEVGSRTLVHAAQVDQGKTHGKYLRDCKVTEPAAFVRTSEGRETQEKVFKELVQELEKISPGIASYI